MTPRRILIWIVLLIAATCAVVALVNPGIFYRAGLMRWADLSDAILRDANLRGATLQNSNLRGANLTRAYLRNAKLQGANLRDADLKGASYDADTIWPEGFDPQAAGAVLTDHFGLPLACGLDRLGPGRVAANRSLLAPGPTAQGWMGLRRSRRSRLSGEKDGAGREQQEVGRSTRLLHRSPSSRCYTGAVCGGRPSLFTL